MSKAYHAYKYRICPDNPQVIFIQQAFGSDRFVYNKLLGIQTENYKNGIKYMSKFDMINYCNQILKTDYPWLRDTDSRALQSAIDFLDTAFMRFFHKVSAYPKFKSKRNGRKSYSTDGSRNGIKIRD